MEPASCYVCKQTRPCCRLPLTELGKRGTHDKFIRTLSGPLREAWGLGCVWETCCKAIYGMYPNYETSRYEAVFLGNHYEEAMSRVNHVKSFYEDKKGAGHQDCAHVPPCNNKWNVQ